MNIFGSFIWGYLGSVVKWLFYIIVYQKNKSITSIYEGDSNLTQSERLMYKVGNNLLGIALLLIIVKVILHFGW
jgi:hypothetical protein